MLAGPLFTRELTITPQHAKHFGIRAGYVAALCILIYTGAQTTFGLVPLHNVGDIARFGTFIFNLLCFVQLVLILAASLLFSAGSVAAEKDRRTLILLLMTDLRATELVIGKTLASLLPVFVLIAVSIPVMCFLSMLGGILFDQIVWVELLCVASSIAAASWGTLVGYWREKTFQILAVTLMGAGLFIGLAETIIAVTENSPIATYASYCNPFRALNQILYPLSNPNLALPTVAAWGPIGVMCGIAIVMWVITTLRVRIWNPSRFMYTHPDQEADPTVAAQVAEIQSEDVAHVVGEVVLEGQSHSNADGARVKEEVITRQSSRPVWNLPIIWREICTQAYGRKVGLIKLAYYIFAVFCILWVNRSPVDAPKLLGVLSTEGLVFILLALIGLILVNAQSVTCLTSERDGQTLELLLVTEVTAKEFIYGKLGGVFFNTKEVIAVPLLVASMSYFKGTVGLESLLFVVFGFLNLVLFSAMLGLHSGLSFHNSRSAIMNSLGTMFFLFVGIFICMMLIVEARTSFELQLAPFLLFILGGSLGLWLSLTYKTPSPALAICAWTLPFLTFYAITSYLLPDYLFAFLAMTITYGFTTIAMLVPAVSAFDVALGRTTINR